MDTSGTGSPPGLVYNASNGMLPKALLLIVLIPALAINYYFVVVLPEAERAKLQFEKDKYAAEKKERPDREAKDAERKSTNEALLQSCLETADQNYWIYIKLNGTAVPGKLGTYNAPMTTWNYADKKKEQDIAECHRQYDK